MNNEKKVILFIVEGGSDKIFFSEFEKVFPQHHVLVHVVKGDVFSNRDLKSQSISKVISDIVSIVLKENSILGIVASDIEYIYQITDTDCCFQKEEFIEHSLDVIRKNKAMRINDVLAMQRYVSNPKYENYKLLFFAPNLEGPLTPDFDLEGKHGGHKQMNMIRLIQNLRNSPEGFVHGVNKILSDDHIAPFEEYFQSWDFIRADDNSKGNYTNLKFIYND